MKKKNNQKKKLNKFFKENHKTIFNTDFGRKVRELMDIRIDDEVWEKLCWTTCIAINPGARNSINGTPKTIPLLGPIAKDITSKNRIAVTTGPKTVWPNTIKNLNVSFL